MRPNEPRLEQLMGLRPSITETVQRSAHTEITIPVRQAQTASLILFSGYVTTLAAMVLVGVTVYTLVFTKTQWPAFLALTVLVLGSLMWRASRKPMAILLVRLLNEIEDPNRNSEMLDLVREMQSHQPARVVREPVPIKVNGTMMSWDTEEDEHTISTDFSDLLEFVQLASERSLARSVWVPVGGPRIRLSSGQIVSRPAYDRLTTQLCDDWQFIEHTPQGFAWTIPSEKVLTILRRITERS